MPEKCPNCKGNHIAFCSSCAKKSKTAEGALQIRKRGTARRSPMSKVIDTNTATGTNGAVLGCKPKGGAVEAGRCKEQAMAMVKEEEAAGEARDVMMTKTETRAKAAT